MNIKGSNILVIGYSTRAFVDSALKGEIPVSSLDYFGDRDQKNKVKNYSLHWDFGISYSPSALVERALQFNYDQIIYTAGIENHPSVVEQIAGNALLGNSPKVLERVGNTEELRNTCREEGIDFTSTIFPGEYYELDRKKRYHLRQEARKNKWLIKPERSGGGKNIRFWNGNRIEEGKYLQKYLSGVPASAAFVADGKRSVLLGISEQFSGESKKMFRSKSRTKGTFRWEGNLFPFGTDEDLETVQGIASWAEETAKKLTSSFGLKGLNGFDFIIPGECEDEKRFSEPCLLEINPRYTGSMELIEEVMGINMCTVHIESFEGKLPDFSFKDQFLQVHIGGGDFFQKDSMKKAVFYSNSELPRVAAKRIVYAERSLVVPDTDGWVDAGIRDIPFSGEVIQRRKPICTVFSGAETEEACRRELLRKERKVRELLKMRRTRMKPTAEVYSFP